MPARFDFYRLYLLFTGVRLVVDVVMVSGAVRVPSVIGTLNITFMGSTRVRGGGEAASRRLTIVGGSIFSILLLHLHWFNHKNLIRY